MPVKWGVDLLEYGFQPVDFLQIHEAEEAREDTAG